MNENTNNGGKSTALTTLTTRYDADAIDVNAVGTIDGITVNGAPIMVLVSGNGKRVDTINVGKLGQLYVENKPVPNTDNAKFAGPRIAVNGKPRKHVNYGNGHFSDSVNGPNSMPRKITSIVVTDATITMNDGTVRTLNGDWTIIGMVKYDHKRDTGMTYNRTIVKRGKNVTIKTVNS